MRKIETYDVMRNADQYFSVSNPCNGYCIYGLRGLFKILNTDYPVAVLVHVVSILYVCI